LIELFSDPSIDLGAFWFLGLFSLSIAFSWALSSNLASVIFGEFLSAFCGLWIHDWSWFRPKICLWALSVIDVCLIFSFYARGGI
jgi:hypothetical protein